MAAARAAKAALLALEYEQHCDVDIAEIEEITVRKFVVWLKAVKTVSLNRIHLFKTLLL